MLWSMATTAKPSIIQDVFEKLGEQVRDTAKSVAAEPGKLATTLLGGEANPEPAKTGLGNDPGIEKLAGQAAGQGPAAAQALLQKKKEDIETSQKKISFFRRQMATWANDSRRLAAEEVQEKQKEQAEEQPDIVQLKRVREKEAKTATLGSGKGASNMPGIPGQVKKKQGTLESSQLKD